MQEDGEGVNGRVGGGIVPRGNKKATFFLSIKLKLNVGCVSLCCFILNFNKVKVFLELSHTSFNVIKKYNGTVFMLLL